MISRDGAVLKDTTTGKIRYVPIIEFASKEIRNKFSDAVVAAMREAYPDALSWARQTRPRT